jgi:hypothetical protein
VTLLVDTNVWVAAQDDKDPDFEVCSELLVERAGTLIVSVPVIAETAWFIEDRHGPAAEAEFLRLVTSGAVTPIDLTLGDWERVAELVETYASLGLGTVDASVIAVAERLELTEIATMNVRDFRVVRPRHCTSFTLLPEGLATP